jgi:NAD(P)-dependent dehydrogenase (short-subunit alcohol dehydrogenase family)
MKWNLATMVGALGAVVVARTAFQRWRESRYDLHGRVVLITGGSRGLGLILARQYARHGARLVLTARDGWALERACMELRGAGADVLGVPCDVSDADQVRTLIDQTVRHFGRIDVVVNDAGCIEVGPLTAMTTDDFAEAMDTNFWGAFNVIHHALPHLQPGQGRILNISSIGGLVSVPHLLPYSVSKFALTGFSLGLRMELAERGVCVTTVCPGLMRTGSPVNARFKGDQAAEFAWFSVADSLPLLSMSAERAARQIVRAGRRGDVLLVLGLPAKLAAIASALFPSLTVQVSSLASRLLPHSADPTPESGRSVERRASGWLTALGDRAAARNNELSSVPIR